MPSQEHCSVAVHQNSATEQCSDARPARSSSLRPPRPLGAEGTTVGTVHRNSAPEGPRHAGTVHRNSVRNSAPEQCHGTVGGTCLPAACTETPPEVHSAPPARTRVDHREMRAERPRGPCFRPSEGRNTVLVHCSGTAFQNSVPVQCSAPIYPITQIPRYPWSGWLAYVGRETLGGGNRKRSSLALLPFRVT